MANKAEGAVPFDQQGSGMMAPGDEAPPGTPGTGEDVCPTCGGRGRLDGQECENCFGRGRVIKAISAGP
jgi:DnaJ-class molecular chaperone